eukprot:CAMPEP_0119316444 /NCGR_PEP_ID=MMETSP1333-20130426/39636_1 /TAXON_ID=418940 /ORGANISM="Scyphosphaera apsteinii, Strain RCC1455" /LENGTH=327 /DNA_ID=CAMNT_0007322089 /DNA_START=111 /DNA_END=1091 /DNA_ORIENTATION=-
MKSNSKERFLEKLVRYNPELRRGEVQNPLDVGGSTGRWALCITGQPRRVAERLTIARLLSNLVGALPSPPDLFVSTTDDFRNQTLLEQRAIYLHRATDMSLLQLRKAFAQSRAVPRITSSCGHHSTCGFLLQLRTTWDCWLAIKAHEQRQAFRYEFFGRTRMDMLWYGTLRPVAWTHVYNGNAVVPLGDDYKGVNDRFILARRADFEVYARFYEDLRLSRAPWNATKMPRRATAELSLRLQLDFSHIVLVKLELPACLLQTLPGNPDCAYCKKYMGDEGHTALKMFRNSPGCQSDEVKVHFCRHTTSGGSVLTTSCSDDLPWAGGSW